MKKIFCVFLLSIQYFIFFCNNGVLSKNLTSSNNKNVENDSSKEEIDKSIKNPWEEYMDKFNIEKNHSSGIKIDLGGTVTLKEQTFRIPAGRCPVFGKGITIKNSKINFLSPVSLFDKPLKLGGLGFPLDFNLSPISIDTLKDYFKKALPNISDGINLCSFHLSQINISGQLDSKYKYPGVYDADNNICYALYVAAQQNMGPRYCNDNPEDNNSMFCFLPEKKKSYENLVYLTSNIQSQWDANCPYMNLEHSKFGTWKNGKCNEIEDNITVETDTLSKCNDVLFSISASDQPKKYEEELYDYDKLLKGIKVLDPNLIGSVLLPSGALSSDKYFSRGSGYNWGHYNKKTKKCIMFYVTPTCLINDKNYISTTALSHPSKIDSFPCGLYLKEIEEKTKSDYEKYIALGNKRDVVIPGKFAAFDEKSLNCPCNPQKLSNSTCDIYICKCIDDGNSGFILTLVIIFLIAGILSILGFSFYIYKFKKKKEAEKYNKTDQADYYGKTKSRGDEVLNPEASFWGEDKRVSQTTPVLMERPYY